MAPKRGRQETNAPQADPEGMFRGMVVLLVEKGVQPRRLQVWKQKLIQMGAVIEERLKMTVTHIFATNAEASLQEFGLERLMNFKGNILSYEWLENSLKSGEKLSDDFYALKLTLEGKSKSDKPAVSASSEMLGDSHTHNDSPENRTPEGSQLAQLVQQKAPKDGEKTVEQSTSIADLENKHIGLYAGDEMQTSKEDTINQTINRCSTGSPHLSADCTGTSKELSLLYNPPDLNRNITDIFGKLINIYRALGDDRRSFSYHKAIPVIEKLPFKIESAQQVKHLPAIGKSIQDHINEIVTTGKLSKLEHFENAEKEIGVTRRLRCYVLDNMNGHGFLIEEILYVRQVRTVTLFGEVWGIGPATALKLYEKGHRTLDDLKNEESLTSAQKLGVKYFNDIKQKIPREEVKEMEPFLQKAGETILPGVIIVCGGSYRRGKAFCGDLDIIITHPDGQSHKGFLAKYVKYLKSSSFLKEDLVFSTHSEEGTDSGVDTYFGLCTYPGREQRHRIDFKVYPRDIYAFGLIAWTGNDVLNRRLRLLAESKGYRLDDTGLFFAAQSSHGKRGASIHCQTEREVFDLLGFPWLEPHERNL